MSQNVRGTTITVGEMLAGWEEVKAQIYRGMDKNRAHRKITDAALQERIERLFAEIPT